MNEREGPLPQAGWYADPDGVSGRLRYWDGELWTTRYRGGDSHYWANEAVGAPLPLDTVRRVAIAGLVLVSLAQALALIAALKRISVDQTFLDGIAVSASDVQRSEDLGLAADIALLTGYVICAATFIAWFQRAYGNLLRLGFRELRYGPGWAIGAWFVPILNLWRPKQIANDIYRGSTTGLSRQSKFWETQPVTARLGWWWGLFLLSGVMGRGAVDTGVHYDDFLTAQTAAAAVRDEKNTLVFTSIGSVIAIIAAILAIYVVIELTDRQKEAIRARELEQATV